MHWRRWKSSIAFVVVHVAFYLVRSREIVRRMRVLHVYNTQGTPNNIKSRIALVILIDKIMWSLSLGRDTLVGVSSGPVRLGALGLFV